MMAKIPKVPFRVAVLSITLPAMRNPPPALLSAVTLSTRPPWPVIKIPVDPIPRTVPLKILIARGPS